MSIGLENMDPGDQAASFDLLREAEKVLGPASEWEGRCYEIACGLVNHGIVKGTAVYGHYVGPINPDGFWKQRAGAPFIQHGWVVDDNGTIFDPTRFSFEGVDPYIYIGESDHYDEGGNAWRSAMERPCPVFRPPSPDDQYPDRYKLIPLDDMPDDAREFVLKIMGYPPAVNNEMVFWLGNLPPHKLGPHLDAIYTFVTESADMPAAIPMDNRRAWEQGRLR